MEDHVGHAGLVVSVKLVLFQVLNPLFLLVVINFFDHPQIFSTKQLAVENLDQKFSIEDVTKNIAVLDQH